MKCRRRVPRIMESNDPDRRPAGIAKAYSAPFA